MGGSPAHSPNFTGTPVGPTGTRETRVPEGRLFASGGSGRTDRGSKDHHKGLHRPRSRSMCSPTTPLGGETLAGTDGRPVPFEGRIRTRRTRAP